MACYESDGEIACTFQEAPPKPRVHSTRNLHTTQRSAIETEERVNMFIECGCCGAFHCTDFDGDCRKDSERHYDLPDDAAVIYLEDQDSN